MKYSIIRLLTATTICLAGSALACAPVRPARSPDPNIIAAHSPKSVSRNAAIRVVFSEPLGKSGIVPDGIMTFSPSVKGTVSWEDESTLAFKPSAPLPSGKTFRATVNPGIDGSGKESPKAFDFEVTARDPFLAINPQAPSISSDGSIFIDGNVEISGEEEDAAIERLFSARQSGTTLPVRWTHGKNGHAFTVSGLKQGMSANKVDLLWNGGKDRSGTNRTKTVFVPGKERFEVVSVSEAKGDDTAIEVAFSRPLTRKQDLRGIVSVSGVESPRFKIEGNKAWVYASASWPDRVKVDVRDSVTDLEGNKLFKPVAAAVELAWQKPAVRYLDQGVIVPTTDGYSIPIETMNLRSVCVEVLKIHGDNVSQFLQVNSLDGNRELERVGTKVYLKTFPLGWKPESRNVWTRATLDLSDLVKKHPDGMFRIKLGFFRDDIEYVCGEGHVSFASLPFPTMDNPTGTEAGARNPERASDRSVFDNYYYPEDWKTSDQYYDNAKDPCHPAFYLSNFNNRVAARNVIVSDIGLLAKAGSDGVTHVYATDMKTARPQEGVKIKALDYQRQVLAETVTSKSGMAIIDSPKSEYLLVAEWKGQKGYLKLDGSSALKTSHFDIEGDMPEKGVKGYLYAERGVWRPGDDIYLMFILDDPKKTVPSNHPISFELESPRGQIVKRAVYSVSENGFYDMRTGTDADAETGDYVARVKFGNREYAKVLKIETVMPNRLKLEIDLGGRKSIKADGGMLTLKSRWLHGAPTPDFKADVSVTFAKVPLTFPSYGDYSFEDDLKEAPRDRVTMFEGRLGKDSLAEFPFDTGETADVPAKMRAQFFSRVFEPSGQFSTEQFSVDYFPYATYAGFRFAKKNGSSYYLYTDKDQEVDVVLLDADGKPVQTGTAECSVYEVHWRWWWERSDENLAEYARSIHEKRISTDKVAVRNGKGTWKFKITGRDWGRYLIEVKNPESGHSATTYVYAYTPWYAENQPASTGSDNQLSLQTDREKYSSGQECQVTFPSNDAAGALVVVEKSGNIVKEEWVKTSPGKTVYRFEATPEMAPNVYVHVTLVQPHRQVTNDLPIRLYGIVAVPVENPKTHLVPVLSGLPETIKPSSEVRFQVSEKSGRPMTYTVAIVDEGLLGLTRFKAQDPWSTFYKREASMLDSWDIFKYVSGAYSGKLETLLAVGGGDDGIDPAAKKAKRFPPVVRFVGPVSIGANERKEHVIAMPEYVGSVRFMVVSGRDGAYGTLEKDVPVKTDLMVYSTLPRVLGPGEEATLPVTVFSYRDGTVPVSVTVETTGAVSVTGPAQASLTMKGVGDQTVSFVVRAGQTPGIAKFKVKAADGRNVAEQNVEMDVRSPSVMQTEVFGDKTGMVDKGKEWKIAVPDFPGLAGTNEAFLEISRVPPLNLESRLGWLIAYPHGCIEQTTSAVFPQLYLDKVIKLPPEKAKKTQDNIKAGIDRYRRFQTASGGFAYWPGESQASPWGTNYAGHFLVEARKAGFSVPDRVFDEWLSYQKTQANNWNLTGDYDNDSLIQAYRLYTLALAGKAEIPAMNRLKDVKNLNVTAKWRLAASYWLSGYRDVAKDMTKSLSWTVPKYRELSYSYGSDFRDTAMILETLNLMGDTARAGPLARQVAERLSEQGTWYSTQETAYALIALLPYSDTGTVKADITYGFASAPGKAPKTQTGSFDKPIASFPIPLDNAVRGEFTVKNDSSVILYPRIVIKGTPEPGWESAREDGLELSVIYTDTSGKMVDPQDLPAGEDMDIYVKVANPSNSRLKDLALEHLMASCFEISNTRLGEDEGVERQEGETSRDDSDYWDWEYYYWGVPRDSGKLYRYQDIRDDRVITYFDLRKRETKTFKVRVNRTYGGTFFLPALKVYAMYDETIQAVEPGFWLKAVSQGKPAATRKGGAFSPTATRD